MDEDGFRSPPPRKAAAAALASMMLGGCMVGPDYQGPPPVVPEAVAAARFHRDPGSTATPPPSRWWTDLGDAQLDCLEDAALSNNPDLEIAVARLRQSRAGLDRDRANLLPTTGTAALALRSKGLAGALGGGGASGGATNFYDAIVDANWELDLFGGRRRAIEGGYAQAQAAEAHLEDVEVSLTAEVAQDYVMLRDLQQRLILAQHNIDVESAMVTLRKRQLAGGTASELDVERLTNQLLTTRANAIPLIAQIAEQLDRLAILTGRAAGSLDSALALPGAVPLPPPAVSVGDPGDLLRRRPDVRAAERMIQQTSALIGQRTADLFPTVRWLGDVGIGSSRLSGLDRGSNIAYAFIPVLQWSPFDFGRTQAAIAEARGEQAEALGRYRKIVLAALQDAETALEAYARQRDSVASLADVEASADRAARLTALRVADGTGSSLDQLNAETTRVSAQSNAAQARAQLTQMYIRLQKSLGLGWSAPNS